MAFKIDLNYKFTDVNMDKLLEDANKGKGIPQNYINENGSNNLNNSSANGFSSKGNVVETVDLSADVENGSSYANNKETDYTSQNNSTTIKNGEKLSTINENGITNQQTDKNNFSSESSNLSNTNSSDKAKININQTDSEGQINKSQNVNINQNGNIGQNNSSNAEQKNINLNNSNTMNHSNTNSSSSTSSGLNEKNKDNVYQTENESSTATANGSETSSKSKYYENETSKSSNAEITNINLEEVNFTQLTEEDIKSLVGKLDQEQYNQFIEGMKKSYSNQINYLEVLVKGTKDKTGYKEILDNLSAFMATKESFIVVNQVEQAKNEKINERIVYFQEYGKY